MVFIDVIFTQKWQVSPGIPGRFPPDWGAGLNRKPWQVSPGFYIIAY